MKTFKKLLNEVNMDPFFDRIENQSLNFRNLKRDLDTANISFKEIIEFFLEVKGNNINVVSKKLDRVGWKTEKLPMGKNKIIVKKKKDSEITISIVKGNIRIQLVN